VNRLRFVVNQTFKWITASCVYNLSVMRSGTVISPGKVFKLLFALLLSAQANGLWAGQPAVWPPAVRAQQDDASVLYLPVIQSGNLPESTNALPIINAPYFANTMRFSEAAIFWFGEITPQLNYTDVRLGFTESDLFVRLTIFDRLLWYDPQPDPITLLAWDAASLYLSLDPAPGSQVDGNVYRFDGQLTWWEAQGDFQAAYRGNGGAWEPASLGYSIDTGWRGNAPNDMQDDRGWVITYRIPFASLGYLGKPPDGSLLRLGVVVYDRDDAASTPIAPQGWPQGMHAGQPNTWGYLRFSLPGYVSPAASDLETVTIRHNLNGAVVPDASVGGDTVCGAGLDFWSEWGEANYAGKVHFNIQNQADVADWPCFSKVYITFPLDQLPAGKEIYSATLTLHQFGGSDPSQAQPSLIQVLVIEENWDEGTITWNNAPLAVENVSQTWVAPLTGELVWPGVPWHWDLSRAVAEVYEAGGPLRLVLYSADSAMHSGKYFSSAERDKYLAEARPTLRVTYGDPSGQ